MKGSSERGFLSKFSFSTKVKGTSVKSTGVIPNSFFSIVGTYFLGSNETLLFLSDPKLFLNFSIICY